MLRRHVVHRHTGAGGSCAGVVIGDLNDNGVGVRSGARWIVVEILVAGTKVPSAFFLLYYRGASRIHSFPTRRSSDLPRSPGNDNRVSVLSAYVGECAA